MSFVKINCYSHMGSQLQGQNDSHGGKQVSRAALDRVAFDTQMHMAQSLLSGDGQAQSTKRSLGIDTSLVNDALMLEALSTINRIMKTDVGGGTLPTTKAVANTLTATPDQTQATFLNADVGALSATFESGKSGVGAIGYDKVGGTSYGKYQIASRPGTMARFLSYLDTHDPQIAASLRQAGPANTGSTEGGMPAEWRRIAETHPGHFEDLQHSFIASETYEPARSKILKETGLDFDRAPAALKEVLWSTAVQHGSTGAARIFNKVIDKFLGHTDKADFNSNLIEGIYSTRKGQFGSSSLRVQKAVTMRLNEEKQLALNMLGEPQINRTV